MPSKYVRWPSLKKKVPQNSISLSKMLESLLSKSNLDHVSPRNSVFKKKTSCLLEMYFNFRDCIKKTPYKSMYSNSSVIYVHHQSNYHTSDPRLLLNCDLSSILTSPYFT